MRRIPARFTVTVLSTVAGLAADQAPQCEIFPGYGAPFELNYAGVVSAFGANGGDGRFVDTLARHFGAVVDLSPARQSVYRAQIDEVGGETAMLHLIWMMLIGLLVGVLAKLIMPGRDPGGMFVTMLLGIAGSLVGGVLGRLLGLYAQNEGAGFIISTLGAVLLLALYRLILRGHPTVRAH